MKRFFNSNKLTYVRTYVPVHELVSIVLLVLGGGIDTLKTVHAALKNKTPVVIVKGSGRMADILACAYKNAKGRNQEGNVQERRVIL